MTNKAQSKGPAAWLILAGVCEVEAAAQLFAAAQAHGMAISMTSAERPEAYKDAIRHADGLVLCLHDPRWCQYPDVFSAIAGRKKPFAGPVIVARRSSRYYGNMRLYFTEQGVNTLYTERDELDVDAVIAMMEAALPGAAGDVHAPAAS